MKIKQTKWDPKRLLCEESIFHTANGYLGVRGNFEEGYAEGLPTIRGCYINGFYDTVELKYPEKLYGFPESAQRMVNLPDAQTMKLSICGEPFSLFEGELMEYERVLDMDAGVTLRRMVWRSPGGKEAEITVTRCASFERRELFLTIYQVSALNFSGPVEIESTVNCDVTNFCDSSDPRVASEPGKYMILQKAEADGGIGETVCGTSVSGLTVAVCQRHRMDRPGENRTCATPNGLCTEMHVTLSQGDTVTVEKYTVFSDSRRQKNPAVHARAVLETAWDLGGETLLEEQRRSLDRFWAVSRVQIDGDEEMALGMEFNLYGLLQGAGRDSISNIPAKGLSGEGYEGHYFWDTEIYMFPFFLLTQPEIARGLLDFRYSVLDGARAHARILGHNTGALFPWRTITGSECSSYYPAGSAQYHITGDVAHSFLQYYDVTGDLEYMARKGAEVLIETARLWACAGHYDRVGRYCIDDVTGPDEYTCLVNNNYYTNRSAKENLLGAIRVCGDLEKAGLLEPVARKIGLAPEELAQFQRVADHMYLPYDKELDINPQDDTFLNKAVWDFSNTPRENYPLLLHYYPLQLYRYQVCKQADTVLAHFLYEEGVAESTMRNSYHYYEKVTTHDSTLSTCIFSIMAARLGMAEKAYEYFLASARTDLDDAHKNTKDGIHAANMGGAYLALVAGFAGLRIHSDGLHFRFLLPRQWKRYRFSLWYRGSLLRFDITKEKVEIRLEEGPAVRIFVEGVPVTVENSVTLKGAA